MSAPVNMTGLEMKSGVPVPNILRQKFLTKNKCQTVLLQCARDEQGIVLEAPAEQWWTLSERAGTTQDECAGAQLGKQQFQSINYLNSSSIEVLLPYAVDLGRSIIADATLFILSIYCLNFIAKKH